MFISNPIKTTARLGAIGLGFGVCLCAPAAHAAPAVSVYPLAAACSDGSQFVQPIYGPGRHYDSSDAGFVATCFGDVYKLTYQTGTISTPFPNSDSGAIHAVSIDANGIAFQLRGDTLSSETNPAGTALGISELNNPSSTLPAPIVYLDPEGYIVLTDIPNETGTGRFRSNFPNTTFDTSIDDRAFGDPIGHISTLRSRLSGGEFLFTTRGTLGHNGLGSIAQLCSGATGCTRLQYDFSSELIYDLARVNGTLIASGKKRFLLPAAPGSRKAQLKLAVPTLWTQQADGSFLARRLKLPFRLFRGSEAGSVIAINDDGSMIGDFKRRGEKRPRQFFWENATKKPLDLTKIIYKDSNVKTLLGKSPLIEGSILTNGGKIVFIARKDASTSEYALITIDLD